MRTAVGALTAAIIALLTPGTAHATINERTWDRWRINQLRDQPLHGSSALHRWATAWALHMAHADALAHDAAGANVCWAMGGRWYGQNVAVGADIGQVEAALEASPEHYANLVNPHFRRVGLGTVHAGGRLWLVQTFCG